MALSWEREAILETGGGLRAALPLLGAGPVFTLNSDAVWTGRKPAGGTCGGLGRRADGCAAAAGRRRTAHAGTRGAADFALDADGPAAPPGAAGRRPGYVYLGAQMIRTEGLAAIPGAGVLAEPCSGTG